MYDCVDVYVYICVWGFGCFAVCVSVVLGKCMYKNIDLHVSFYMSMWLFPRGGNVA